MTKIGFFFSFSLFVFPVYRSRDFHFRLSAHKLKLKRDMTTVAWLLFWLWKRRIPLSILLKHRLHFRFLLDLKYFYASNKILGLVSYVWRILCLLSCSWRFFTHQSTPCFVLSYSRIEGSTFLIISSPFDSFVLRVKGNNSIKIDANFINFHPYRNCVHWIGEISKNLHQKVMIVKTKPTARLTITKVKPPCAHRPLSIYLPNKFYVNEKIIWINKCESFSFIHMSLRLSTQRTALDAWIYVCMSVSEWVCKI